MALRFIAIDPDTDTNHCPAVFVDESTGDLLFQGWTVTEPGVLSEVSGHSRIAGNESIVRLPARMRDIIMEALSDRGTAIPRADRVGEQVGDPSGDARLLRP
jgi:hypothetical protein